MTVRVLKEDPSTKNAKNKIKIMLYRHWNHRGEKHSFHCQGGDGARFQSFYFESVPMPGCTILFSLIWMRRRHYWLLFPAVPEGQCACCPESARHGRELPQGMLGCAERGEKQQLSHRRYVILSYTEGEEPAFSPAQKVGDFLSFIWFIHDGSKTG